LVPIL